MKKTLLILVSILILVPTLIYGEDIIYETEKAEVLEVAEPEETMEGYFQYNQKMKLKILTGRKKGQVVMVENALDENSIYNINVKPGEKVSLTIENINGEEEIYISDYYRLDSVGLLILVFMGLVILVGGRQGVRSLVSLGLTIAGIFYILLPGILKGGSPIGLSILVSIGVTIITIIIITGLTKKSLSAIIGTSLGVIIAGLVAFVTGKTTKLTGLSAEDVIMLMEIPQGIEFNLQELLFSGIILGALGAVMDVGMSIASAIDEIYENKKDLAMLDLFRSGMNVGKDIMGTMINTLILAYTGGSISILLLFLAYDSSLMEVMNLDMIATEIVRSISGSIGLILTIPITSFVASFLLTGFKNKEATSLGIIGRDKEEE